MSTCALYFYLEVVKRFESPKALYKFPIIIVIIALLILYIFCRPYVCMVRLGLTLGVSAWSILFYITCPITRRTTCKNKLLIFSSECARCRWGMYMFMPLAGSRKRHEAKKGEPQLFISRCTSTIVALVDRCVTVAFQPFVALLNLTKAPSSFFQIE